MASVMKIEIQNLRFESRWPINQMAGISVSNGDIIYVVEEVGKQILKHYMPYVIYHGIEHKSELKNGYYEIVKSGENVDTVGDKINDRSMGSKQNAKRVLRKS